MSEINIIKFLLDMEEENLVIDENLPIGLVKLSNGITAKHISLKTSTSFVICPICGQIISKLHDYRTIHIKHFSCGKQPLIISIKKKRFKCTDCNKNITENINLVEKNCFISNGIKRSITFSLTQIGSIKNIAIEHNVSPTTVFNSLNKVPNSNANKRLPEVLSFDEFKANTTEGKYAFMAVDPINKKILEVLPNRKFNAVFSFFSRYSRKERNKVKFIIIDLWKPYEKIIAKLFPSATLVADKFHYQRLVNNSLNEIRKQACAKMDSKRAYQVKKHWRLLNKNYNKVNDQNIRFSYLLKRNATDLEILNYILSLDKDLNIAYNFYQDFLYITSLSEEKLQIALLDKWIEKARYCGIKELELNAKTFSAWYSAIASSFKTFEGSKLSNGFIEGTNNKIKVIKRVSFGYKSFVNFRKRILLICS